MSNENPRHTRPTNYKINQKTETGVDSISVDCVKSVPRTNKAVNYQLPYTSATI